MAFQIPPSRKSRFKLKLGSLYGADEIAAPFQLK